MKPTKKSFIITQSVSKNTCRKMQNVFSASIVFITGAILFIWFAIPLFIGVLNSGNGIGLTFSALLILYGVFFEKVNSFIRNLGRTLWGKVLLSIISLVLSVIIVFAAVCTVNMILASNNRPDGETTLVVLGCQVHSDGQPSLMLEKRLAAAYGYLKENENIKCVVSGGQGDDEVISEAQCMYNWLVGKGIDSKRLFIEDRSATTRENLLFTKKIIKENGLNPVITIVTNGFHQYRAARIARSIGFESYSISGKSFLSMLPTYYVRELGGILYEIILEE